MRTPKTEAGRLLAVDIASGGEVPIERANNDVAGVEDAAIALLREEIGRTAYVDEATGAWCVSPAQLGAPGYTGATPPAGPHPYKANRAPMGSEKQRCIDCGLSVTARIHR
jgi:hypothetical protein